MAINPAAPHHLPAFITAPGESDIFLNGAAVFLVVMVLLLGSVYFRLHALPEHMAHKNANKLQFEIVAVLALLALFTHNNVFWFGALLLALVPIPDFHGPLTTMADALARMAGFRRQAPADEPSASRSWNDSTTDVRSEGAAVPMRAEMASASPEQTDPTLQADGHAHR